MICVWIRHVSACTCVVIRHQAGKAELKLVIVGPRGNSLPFTMNATALGDHVVYTPRERGPHLIYVTYGGLDVPGVIFYCDNIAYCERRCKSVFTF